MNVFDQRPIIFRLCTATLLSVYLVLIAVTTYNYAGSPTDENLFRDLPFHLYVTKPVPGIVESSFEANGSTVLRGALDSIGVGDFLVELNGKAFGGQNQFDDALSTVQTTANDEFTLQIFRPALNQFIRYRIQKKSIPLNFLREVGTYAYVSEVTPGGASDRAGMKIGDLIIRINGKSFKTSSQADVILRTSQTGKNLLYEVVRSNRTVELHVTLATFGFPIPLLLLTLAGLAYLALGAFIALKRPTIRAGRLLALSFMMIGYAVALAATRREVDQSGILFFRNALLVVSFFLSVAVSFHAGVYFPLERPELLRRRWIIRSYYVAAVAAFAILMVFEKTVGLYSIFIGVAWGVGVSLFFRKEASTEYKRLNVVMRRTGYLTVILVAAGMAVPLLTVGQLTQGFVGYLGVVLMLPLFSHLYSIGRYRLLDLNLRLRRNVQYSFVTAMWAMVMLLAGIALFTELPRTTLPMPNIIVTGSSIEITDTSGSNERREQLQRIGFMLVGLAVAFGFWRVRNAGQGVIDKKFFRAHYDYRTASTELAEVLATKLSMHDLAKGIVEKISVMMQLKRAGVLFFRDECDCCSQEAHGFDGEAWKSFCVKEGKAIGEAVMKFRGEFRVDYLPAGIKELFQEQRIQYLVPIRSKNELIGVLLIGEKMAESTFHQEDFAFLIAAATQASISIENAFLYEELAEKERLKRELEIARKIQLDSLPQSVPNIAGLDIAGISVPAMEVGGDFFDYLDGSTELAEVGSMELAEVGSTELAEIGSTALAGVGSTEKLTVVVGDVSGKGTSAALYMSKVQGVLRSLHGFNLSPRELFIRANKLLCRDLEKRSFVTVSGAEFDPKERTVDFSRAGHLPLLYYNAARGSVERLVPKGLGLGLNDEQLFVNELKQTRINYHPGDVLLFVTDGVTEAHNGVADQFGEDRLERTLLSNVHASAEKICNVILDEVKAFVGSAMQHDDQTIVVVKAV